MPLLFVLEAPWGRGLILEDTSLQSTEGLCSGSAGQWTSVVICSMTVMKVSDYVSAALTWIDIKH